MVAISKEVPDALKPYLFHGVRLDWKNPQKGTGGRMFAMGDCPFCGKDDKLSVDVEKGLYSCFKCGVKEQNHFHFIRWLHEVSCEKTTEYSELSDDRKFLNGVGLLAWGVCKSSITGDWLIPGYSVSEGAYGNLCQLYKYSYSQKEQRYLHLPTPGLGPFMHGINTIDREKLVYFICEGWSDGVALWEILSQIKETDTGHAPTSDASISLLSDCNVVAIPTASIFMESWCSLFDGKVVTLMLDNDHESINKNTGKPIDGSGLHHTKRIAKLLMASDTPPQQINWLEWGEIGYNKEFPSGYDVRDFLSLTEGELQDKINASNSSSN